MMSALFGGSVAEVFGVPGIRGKVNALIVSERPAFCAAFRQAGVRVVGSGGPKGSISAWTADAGEFHVAFEVKGRLVEQFDSSEMQAVIEKVCEWWPRMGGKR